jgi:hypothetical protein
MRPGDPDPEASMKRVIIAIVLALLIGLPAGWIIAMLSTPVLWSLEPKLHMELAGHSGPSDWIFYVVWLIVIPSLFVFFRWIMNKSSAEKA